MTEEQLKHLEEDNRKTERVCKFALVISILSLIFSLLILLFPNKVQAKTDYMMHGATVLLVADWAQTRWISRSYSEGYYETNKIMGKYPETKDVDRYFGSVLLIHYLINTVPIIRNYKKYWNTGLVTIQLGAVTNNYSIGIKMKF